MHLHVCRVQFWWFWCTEVYPAEIGCRPAKYDGTRPPLLPRRPGVLAIRAPTDIVPGSPQNFSGIGAVVVKSRASLCTTDPHHKSSLTQLHLPVWGEAHMYSNFLLGHGHPARGATSQTLGGKRAWEARGQLLVRAPLCQYIHARPAGAPRCTTRAPAQVPPGRQIGLAPRCSATKQSAVSV